MLTFNSMSDPETCFEIGKIDVSLSDKVFCVWIFDPARENGTLEKFNVSNIHSQSKLKSEKKYLSLGTYIVAVKQKDGSYTEASLLSEVSEAELRNKIDRRVKDCFEPVVLRKKKEREKYQTMKANENIDEARAKADEILKSSNKLNTSQWNAFSHSLQIVCLMLWKQKALSLLDEDAVEIVEQTPIVRALYAFLCCVKKETPAKMAYCFADATGFLLRDIVDIIDKKEALTPELKTLFYEYHQKMSSICWNLPESSQPSIYMFRNFLLGIGYSPDFKENKIMKQMKLGNGCRFDVKIFAFAEVLVRSKAKKRLRCEHCGDVLYPDFYFSKYSRCYELTVFRCRAAENTSEDHDSGVYINHCYYCKNLIDSRISCVHETDLELISSGSKKGYYLCACCGGGGSKNAPRTVCPSKRKDGDTRIHQVDNTESQFVKCLTCGFDGAKYEHLPPIPSRADRQFSKNNLHRIFHQPSCNTFLPQAVPVSIISSEDDIPF